MPNFVSGPTVIIADSNQEIRIDIAEAIAATDPTALILEVSDGRSFAHRLKNDTIDLIFVDVTLPGNDASILQHWRSSRGKGGMIVLISDMLAPRWPSVAQLIGAYEVLLKPLNINQISRILSASQIIRRKLQFLLVAPHKPTRNVIRRLLSDSHFSLDVIDAEHGASALRTARFGTADVALIDTAISDGPALEIACKINNISPSTKLILMGSSECSIPSRQMSTFGISNYLRKPFSFADVDKSLHEAFDLWHPYLIKALQLENAVTVRNSL
ncbi:response regulator [Methylobacterium sp. D48H]